MEKLPLELYNRNQIKELEVAACQKYGISGFELMSRAGYQIFERLLRHYPDTKSVVVFCGGGNNAGDGYVVATLALAAGLDVSVYYLADPARLNGDALTAYQNYLQADGKLLPYRPESAIQADVVVDALLGTGLARVVQGGYAAAINAINAGRFKVVAVDIPSGLNADTGMVMGCAVKASLTVTFIGLKQGLFTGQAADFCGGLEYAPLAVPTPLFRQVPTKVVRVTKQPMVLRKRYAHKGDFGHVLVIGGEQGYSGAVRLAGEAALRVGAGLVSIATRAAHAGMINIGRPELMCHGVGTVAELDSLLDKANVVVIGPGLGQSDWAKALFSAAVQSGKCLVIDADALTILARLSEVDRGVLTGTMRCILTPHVGEAGRLLNCTNPEISADRFAAVTAIQAKYGGVAVLKGAGTLIADGDGIAVSDTGNPGMASGGMGDVLSGVIGGLLAQAYPLAEAARQGVYLHGLAADLSAQEHGERGLLARDLMPYLRKLVN